MLSTNEKHEKENFDDWYIIHVICFSVKLNVLINSKLQPSPARPWKLVLFKI